jgi:hypothetical protein
MMGIAPIGCRSASRKGSPKTRESQDPKGVRFRVISMVQKVTLVMSITTVNLGHDRARGHRKAKVAATSEVMVKPDSARRHLPGDAEACRVRGVLDRVLGGAARSSYQLRNEPQ